MARSAHTLVVWLLALIHLSDAQQQCYFGPGAENRGPTNLVPCMNTGQSACCLLGDVCLSGSTCWNFATGNLYQYGCTDISYEDESCPYKCGFDPTLSPWTALEYCVNAGVNDTWVCHSPESCGCEWKASTEMLILEPRQCKDMGSDARAALYAPSVLAPYLSLPTSIGGSTGYFSTTTSGGGSSWVQTVIPGYTPSVIQELTNYGSQPTQAILINAKAKPSASTNKPASAVSATTSSSSAGPTAETSKNTTTPTKPDSGLSTAAKAGIGAGVGGGVLVTALLAVIVLLCQRSRKRRAEPQSAQQHQNQNQYPYPSSSPMPTSPFFAEAEKHSWNAAAYSGAGSSPPMLSPQFDPTSQGQHSSHLVPSLYSSEARSQKQEPSVSPPLPMELAADRYVHELHSEQAMGNERVASAAPEYKR